VFDLCPWKTSLDVKAATSDEVPSYYSSKGVCGLSATVSGLIGIADLSFDLSAFNVISPQTAPGVPLAVELGKAGLMS
jgi:hypothetical protein